MRRPQLLFLTKYTALNAAVRYRAWQYRPFLEQAGFECTLVPLFPSKYLHRLYGANSRRQALLGMVPLVSLALARRWWFVTRDLSRYDVVFLQYEALPYLPLFVERVLFGNNTNVVVDYDDAVHLTYQQHRNPAVRRLLGAKLPGIVAHSRQVIVANSNLADWASRFNPNVTIIPNSLDLSLYSPRVEPLTAPSQPVIGWIGTPVTAPYLQALSRPLRALRERHDFVLKVIGAPSFTMEGVDVRAIAWDESSEVDELRSCDIGIMPLPDDPWARGKSALKLIQYLAVGVAAVASPVGANREVLRDGENGFLALTEDEWVDRLETLIVNPLLRERVARAGRQTAERRFSLHTNAPRFVDTMHRAAM